MGDMIDLDAFCAGPIWYLKPLDKTDPLLISVEDMATGEMAIPLFSKREYAIEFMRTDIRHLEHVEPAMFNSAKEIVFRTKYRETKGLAYVGIGEHADPAIFFPMQDFCRRFED